MESGRQIFTPAVVALLVVLWVAGTAAASFYPGVWVFEVGIAFLAVAMALLAWRRKALLFVGGFAMNRVEALFATAGAVLFLSFVASGFVIPLLE